MASRDAEESVFQAAKNGLTLWLSRARDAVMTPWRQYRAQPDPQAIAQTVPVWQAQVDRILAALTPALREGWAAAHLPGDFDPADPYIQANLAMTYNLLVRIPDEVHALVVREILEGANAGESLEQIARRVDRVLTYTDSERWNGRARNIAVTESTRHRNSSLLAHGLLSQKNGRQDLVKMWDTTMDDRERTAHRLANDKAVPLDQPFIVDGETLMFPGDPTGSPDNVCHCVPASTMITSSGIEAAFRFTWTGTTFDLLRESGIRTTVSPNHPMLTERGWVTASELVEGDQLVCARLSNALSGAQPDEDGGPASAEKVFESLRLSGSNQRVSHLSVDFYGDRPQSEVDVISTNRKLRVGVQAADEKHLEKFEFACANASIAPGSTSGKFILRGDATPNGSVSVSDLLETLSVGHGLPLQGLGLRLRTGRHAGPLQPEINRTAGNVQLLRKDIDGFASEIFLDKLLQVDLNPLATMHLYTFQTHSGTYLADGIVSHNCRCDLRLVTGLGKVTA